MNFQHANLHILLLFLCAVVSPSFLTYHIFSPLLQFARQSMRFQKGSGGQSFIEIFRI